MVQPRFDLTTTTLRYPFEDQDKYKGKIKFKTFKTVPPSGVEFFNNGSQLINNVIDSRREEENPDAEDIEIPTQTVDNASQNTVSRSSTKWNGESCTLYMPPNIVVTDNLDYNTNVPLGIFGSIVENTIASGGSFAGALGSAALDAGKSVIDAIFNGAEGQGADLARLQLSRLAGVFGEGTEGAIRSGLQTTPNPNIRAIFKSVNLRDFVFQFKFTPKSQSEAEEIKKIVYFFRKNMYPESIQIGDISAGYKFPNKFDISLGYHGTDGPTGLGAENEYNREQKKKVATLLKKCYLRNVQTNYNPTTMAFFNDGNFQEVDLSLVFVEEQTLDRQDIEAGY